MRSWLLDRLRGERVVLLLCQIGADSRASLLVLYYDAAAKHIVALPDCATTPRVLQLLLKRFIRNVALFNGRNLHGARVVVALLGFNCVLKTKRVELATAGRRFIALSKFQLNRLQVISAYLSVPM